MFRHRCCFCFKRPPRPQWRAGFRRIASVARGGDERNAGGGPTAAALTKSFRLRKRSARSLLTDAAAYTNVPSPDHRTPFRKDSSSGPRIMAQMMLIQAVESQILATLVVPSFQFGGPQAGIVNHRKRDTSPHRKAYPSPCRNISSPCAFSRQRRLR